MPLNSPLLQRLGYELSLRSSPPRTSARPALRRLARSRNGAPPYHPPASPREVNAITPLILVTPSGMVRVTVTFPAEAVNCACAVAGAARAATTTTESAAKADER